MARVVVVVQQAAVVVLSQSHRSVVVLVMATLFGSTTTASSTSNNGPDKGDVFEFLFGSTTTIGKAQADLHRTKRSKPHDKDNGVIMPPVTTRSRSKRRSKKYTRPIFKDPLNLPSSTSTVLQVGGVDDSHDNHRQRGPSIVRELFGEGATAPTAGNYSEGRGRAKQPSYNSFAWTEQLVPAPSEQRFSLNNQYNNDDQNVSGGKRELEKRQWKASLVYPRPSYRNGPNSSRPAYGRSYSSPLYKTQPDDESVVTVSDLDNLAAKSLRSRKSVSSRASYTRVDRISSNCCGNGGVGENRIDDLTTLREEIAEMVGSMDQDEDNFASAAAAFCREQRDAASALRGYFVFDRSSTKDQAEVESREDSRGLHRNMWSDMQSYWVCKCSCMDV